MKINIIGTYFGQTGYDIHTRSLAYALDKAGIEVSVTAARPPQWLRLVDDRELNMMNRDPEKADVNLFIGLPPYWDLYTCEDKPFIGFCVWEGDSIPLGWKDNLEDIRVNQIWTPSKHTKEAILKVCPELGDKIKIVPHGVDLDIFNPDNSKKEELFSFVANKGWRGGWNDRGGLQYVFKAFNEEFTKDDKVQLIVKLNTVYANIDIQKELDLLLLDRDKAPIKIISDNIPYKSIAEVYNKGHVFVSANMGESFGLPGIEAMACGLPNIQTDFGGQTDYCNSKNSWLIDGELFEVKHDVMYEGIKWKRPSINHLRKLLRYCYEHQDEVKEKSLDAVESARQYTWYKSAEVAKQYLNDITI